MIGAADILRAQVLVVDDSPVNVLLLERMLGAAGYSAVSSTTDPRAVCGLYREHRHDLILLDLKMPGMDGFEVMQGLSEIETEGYLPVLVLTAEPGHKLRALQAGAKDFISKPFDQVEVLTRIHNLLEVRLLLREARSYGQLLERYDPLTGLPNRVLCRELLTRALAASTGGATDVAVLCVAVDRLKDVNDALGRLGGDALLRSVRDRLVACLGPRDAAAHLEGGVFALVVTGAADAPRGAEAVATRVRAALQRPLQLEGAEVAVTASIGIAVSAVDATDAETLMKCADTALHEAKSAGRDHWRFYSEEMNARAREALAMENALRSALEHDEFVLHYQPKMRVVDGAWSGAEALIRWDRPGHGLCPPSAFVPVLEHSGLIVPVGSWVIRTACRQIAEWARCGLGFVRVAVNVSAQQFLRDGFVQEVAHALGDNGVPPEWLDIEITESCLMSRREQTDQVLRELKASGIRIAIDDFGTGYSSLSYLKRFPVDSLKLDISFVRDLATDPATAAIAVAILGMAHSLKLKVIAEGVETETQLEFLRRHACDEVQGYLCARPMPAAEWASVQAARA
ncbi:MAG: EAL domain-containing protein [Vicinamibacteria bacterium]|nr:EAL domain-containing protein [Vicinamibacteria bacterium]